MQGRSFKEEEITLNCSDGIQLAAKRWSSLPPISPSSVGNTNVDVNDNGNDNGNDNNTEKRRKIFCIHGWLDNGASFHIVGPQIVKQLGDYYSDAGSTTNHVDIVAIDLPGHGFSSHKSPDGPPQLLSEYALYTAEALHSLNWINGDGAIKRNCDRDRDRDRDNVDSNEETNNEGEGVTLIGHSMGAGVALLFAAAYPEHVDNLILLEGYGPLASRGEDAAQQVRNAIQRRIMSNRKLYPELSEGGSDRSSSDDMKSDNKIKAEQGVMGKKRYANLEGAISARVKTASLSPGEQWISREAATALVGRAVIRAGEVMNPTGAGGEEIHPSSYFGPVYFRHDSRLMWPSLQYFTEEQVKALMNDTQCPSCLIVAEDGWPSTQKNEEMVKDILQPTVFQRLPGSHHFHADPDDALEVCKMIVTFLLRNG